MAAIERLDFLYTKMDFNFKHIIMITKKCFYNHGFQWKLKDVCNLLPLLCNLDMEGCVGNCLDVLAGEPPKLDLN